MQVSGLRRCGKTWYVKNFLCDPESPFDRILCFYAQSQPLHAELPKGTVFMEGLPNRRVTIKVCLSPLFGLSQ